MLRFLRKYRTITLVTLALLVNIPCSLKRELKLLLAIEVNQGPQSGQGAVKVPCTTYCGIQEGIQEAQFAKQQEPGFPALRNALTGGEVPFRLLYDRFSALKEKIPSYLLYRKLLIGVMA